MPNPVKSFWNTVRVNNVDDKILEHPAVESKIKLAEEFGIDLAEKTLDKIKNKPLKPSGPTPTYKESAFVKPKKETSLYNVSNYENKVPVVTKASQVFKNLSYSVRGLTVKAAHKFGRNKSFGPVAGEKVGFEYTTREGNSKNAYSLTYNVGNQKASLTYKYGQPNQSYSVSIYKQGGDAGITTKYSNHQGLEAALSVDTDSASGKLSYRKETNETNVEVGAFATSGYKYKNPLVGVAGRVSF